LGKDVAVVNPNIVGCTFKSEPYWDDKYCFWDTAGLDEQNNGLVTASDAISALISLIRNVKGICCAIFVTSWAALNDTSTKRNWDLFITTMFDNKVPVVTAITGRGIESSNDDQAWIDAQKKNFETLGLIQESTKPSRCVVYSKPISEVNQAFKSAYQELRKISKQRLVTLIETNKLAKHFKLTGELSLFDFFKKVWNTICKFFGWHTIAVTVREGFKELLIKLGFSDGDAHKIASESFTS